MFTINNLNNLIEEVEGINESPLAAGRLHRALEQWRGHLFSAAKKSFRNSLREDPQLGEPHIYLGNIYFFKRKFDEALKEYQEAERYKPLKQVAQANKVVVYLALKEYPLAAKILRNLITKYSDYPMVLAVAGRYYLNTGDYKVSISYLEESIKKGVLKKEPYSDLTCLYVTYLRDYDKTIEFSTNPNLPSYVKQSLLFQNNLAYAFIKSNRIAEAKAILDPINLQDVIKEPDPLVACSLHATKGLLSIYMDDLADGNRLYKKAKDIVSGDVKMLVEQKRLIENGYFYLRGNNLLEAEKCLKSSLKYETPPEFPNNISEALEYLEMVFQKRNVNEPIMPRVYEANEKIVVDISVNKISSFLSFLNKKLVGDKVSVLIKYNGRYEIKKFLKSKWDTITDRLLYYFLLPSTVITWKNASLYSSGDGYYLLEFNESSNLFRKSIIEDIKEKFESNEQRDKTTNS